MPKCLKCDFRGPDGVVYSTELGMLVECPCCGGDPEAECECESSSTPKLTTREKIRQPRTVDRDPKDQYGWVGVGGSSPFGKE